MIPRATYRLQFTARFGFRDAAAIAPYLADLGVSHVYASPFFAARPGSTHGYDVVDHNRLNPELGDEADFRAMVEALRRHGLGLIADFVPNHMGIGGAANAFWLDVLEWGAASPYAPWFDIDWNAAEPGLVGKVLVPFLGAPYGEALANGDLELRFDPVAGEFAVWAHGAHKLPVCPRHYGDVLRRTSGLVGLAAPFDGHDDAPPTNPRWREAKIELARAALDPDVADGLARALTAFRGRPGDLASWSDLDALVARQHWRASKFNFDGDAINYRRFFVISDLAGLRVERPEIFDATHRLLLDLLNEGAIDGVRIDHIDGLRDPKAYALRLRERAGGPFYLLVEKILAPDERLPEDWGADGTTGYEFANLLVGLLTNPAATDALTRCHRDFTGRLEPPEEVVRAGKLEIMAGPMAAEIESVAVRLHALAQRDPRTRDFGRHSLRAGLVEVIAGLDVYRTYADATGASESDRARVAAAVECARARAPRLDPGVFDFIAAALTLDLPDGGEEMLDAAMRAQQVSGPIMAKGLEDTALYRYTRLIALNEVGSEPGRYGVEVDAFHAANAERLAREPNAMLATSTHDTKRGEDARLRIAAISADPDLWRAGVFAWRDMLARAGAEPIDPNDAYFLHQLLLGAWPAEWGAGAKPSAAELDALRARVEEAMLKSVREAGVNSRWVFGDAAYEARLSRYVAHALDPDGEHLRSFRAAAAAFGAYGAADAIVQTALKLTVPGVPDIYQGAELWEQSLVDPDNRRDVDFAARAAALAELRRPDAPPLAAGGLTARFKLGVIARLLDLRRRTPQLFARGAYEPLRAPGDLRVCAFTRRLDGEALLVAAALGWRAEDRDRWGAANGSLFGEDAARATGVLDGRAASGPLFDESPVFVGYAGPR